MLLRRECTERERVQQRGCRLISGWRWSPLVCALAVLATARDTFTVASGTTTVTTTTTISAAAAGCSGMVMCMDDPPCARCVSAINETSGFPHTSADTPGVAIFASMFATLSTTNSCSTTSSSPSILGAALESLLEKECGETYRMPIGPCVVAEYACFVDPNCRQCLSGLFHVVNISANHSSTNAETKSAVLRSPSCVAMDPAGELVANLLPCYFFPTCTYYKQQCIGVAECAQCLAKLVVGDGADAARQCSQKDASQEALDNVVGACVAGDEAVCGFAEQRCAQNANCSACLAGMSNSNTGVDIVNDFSSASCIKAMQDSYASAYLLTISQGCPGISHCRATVSACLLGSNHRKDLCGPCVDGSAPAADAAICSAILQGVSCDPCPASVHTINRIVFVTVFIGGASAAICVWVIATIVAHGRDRASMRDRIVVGLMLANAVYSTANAIPLNALHTDVDACGQLAMSFDAIRFGRAWWFCGKYGLVSFELLIVGTSIRALLQGLSAVPRRAEAMLHALCVIVALAAFVAFYAVCADINTSGYNSAVETEAFTNARNHASAADDFDDDTPTVAASQRFDAGRSEYDALVRNMLVAWDVLVGVAVALWIVLRLMYVHALREMRVKADADASAEASDVWADTRRTAWRARRTQLEARQEAFGEVAKPLEPYIALFVLFTGPAIVMSTSFCQSHSGASASSASAASLAATYDNAGTASVTYGTCDVWCEFALAFRSLGTIIVYLMPLERRGELAAVRTTWRKLRARAMGCIHPTRRRPYASIANSYDDEGDHEMLELTSSSSPLLSSSSSSADTTSLPSDASAQPGAHLNEHASWYISESDVTMRHCVGRGGYGDVWEGQLGGRRVAVKVLQASMMDDDGHMVDPTADEDFRKECAALQLLNSPYVLKFFGFGTTAEGGNGFIVTEFMSGGSLEDVLHDPQRDLAWRSRISIGLQVALGMEHLHMKHMLHRDLKSPNVLLDELLTAKVCDFGLARVVRPSRQRVVMSSSFTGVTRVLPTAHGIENIKSTQPHLLSLASNTTRNATGVATTAAARIAMTKAAGSLLWMAPEVFRGDRFYGPPVDVYSFGILLWELATREPPWADLPAEELAFFDALNHALQSGERPLVPQDVESSHPLFVSVMRRCWAGDPDVRPTFAEVTGELASCLRDCSA
jgi:serine/threonine protein kinase